MALKLNLKDGYSLDKKATRKELKKIGCSLMVRKDHRGQEHYSVYRDIRLKRQPEECSIVTFWERINNAIKTVKDER